MSEGAFREYLDEEHHYRSLPDTADNATDKKRYDRLYAALDRMMLTEVGGHGNGWAVIEKVRILQSRVLDELSRGCGLTGREPVWFAAIQADIAALGVRG